MKQIDLYQLPLDPDEGVWHEFQLRGPIVMMGTQTSSYMNFWAEEDSALPPETVQLRVVRSGVDIPSDATVEASCWDPWGGTTMLHLIRAAAE